MTILVTNIVDNSLNEDIIKESFEKSVDLKGNPKINKIISFKLYSNDEIDWKSVISESTNISIEEYVIDNIEDMELSNQKIDEIIDPLFETMAEKEEAKREYIQVIVDSSIFGFYILNSMKKFNVNEVFILNDGELNRFQTCICDDS